MYKLQPIAVTVASENSYRVRFKSDTGEVEYTFTIYEEPFVCIEAEIPFADATHGDPAVDVLKKAILEFHEARHFQYVDESTAADIRPSQSGTEPQKKASA